MRKSQLVMLTVLTFCCSTSLTVRAQTRAPGPTGKSKTLGTAKTKSGVTVVRHDSRPLTKHEHQVIDEANKSMREMEKQKASAKMQSKMNSSTERSTK